MKSKQVCGIIYIGAHNRTIQSIPRNLKIPVVVTYGEASHPNMISVNYDDTRGAYEAVTQLIAEGHRRIGLVTGENRSRHTADRLKGYDKALQDNGILFDPSLIYQGDWTRDSGYKAGDFLLSKKVTAIFCMNDVMAAGIYDCADKHGLSIGKDLSVIGFDNRDICTVLKPELSTVALPLSYLGSYSAKILIDQIEQNTSTSECRNLKIPCELIFRHSTSPITTK